MRRISEIAPVITCIAFLLCSCKSTPWKPSVVEPVRDLDATYTADGDLVVTWENPADFERVQAELLRTYFVDSRVKSGLEQGPVRRASKVDDLTRNLPVVARSRGQVRVVLSDVPPGEYKVKVGSGNEIEKRWVEKTLLVPGRPSSEFVLIGDIEKCVDNARRVDDQRVETRPAVDILYMIHPEALSHLEKRGRHVMELFRIVTAQVFGNISRTSSELPIELQGADETGLGVVERIERWADLVARARELEWPLRPDMLVLVDLRLGSDRVPGQLILRVHDLGLGESLTEAKILRQDLFNVRPLIYEGYVEVDRIADLADEAEIARVFREAWLASVCQMLVDARFTEYLGFCTVARKDSEGARPLTESQLQKIRDLYFAKLSLPTRPYDPKADDPQGEYEKRANAIQQEILFGPGFSGPKDEHPNDRFAPPEGP